MKILFLGLFLLLSNVEAKMTFTEACAPYINKYGTFNQTPGESEQNSGNALLYTATYYQIKYELEEISRITKIADKYRFYNIINDYSMVRGLLNRKPGDNKELQGWDDYIGIINVASLLDEQLISNSFLGYGRQHFWFFNNTVNSTTLRHYFGRNFNFISHSYFASNRVPPIFERAKWVIGLLHNAFFKDGASETILAWHFIKCYERQTNRFTFCDLAVKIWKEKLIKQFPNQMGSVFEEYYNKDHPFAVYMKDRI